MATAYHTIWCYNPTVCNMNLQCHKMSLHSFLQFPILKDKTCQHSCDSAKLHLHNPPSWDHIIKLQEYGFCQKQLPSSMDPHIYQSHIKKLSRLYLLSCSEMASWLRSLVTSLRNVWMCVLMFVAVSPLLISRGEAGSDTGWSSLIWSIL